MFLISNIMIEESIQARTQGGCIPPPGLKRCWHDTWFHWKSSPKYFSTAHYSL